MGHSPSFSDFSLGAAAEGNLRRHSNELSYFFILYNVLVLVGKVRKPIDRSVEGSHPGGSFPHRKNPYLTLVKVISYNALASNRIRKDRITVLGLPWSLLGPLNTCRSEGLRRSWAEQ
jgi:hypothetical protein